MNVRGKTTGVIRVFNTLFVGCYRSGLIDPNDCEKEKIYSGNIGEAVFSSLLFC